MVSGPEEGGGRGGPGRGGEKGRGRRRAREEGGEGRRRRELYEEAPAEASGHSPPPPHGPWRSGAGSPAPRPPGYLQPSSGSLPEHNAP